ncbi:hypothetical protein M0638_28120 [Roseomonas sp. NAR14]|uniref:Uncharacterized protein n=1 Tax=Roseomonas acroporae TaxID=2937791 RepID=A0A9X1YLN0_9PROT|nr:hypothetical protein [Roseomonas acroporae]MCK8788221.1 hypothetical protein [Roseomonas acroporae]
MTPRSFPAVAELAGAVRKRRASQAHIARAKRSYEEAVTWPGDCDEMPDPRAIAPLPVARAYAHDMRPLPELLAAGWRFVPIAKVVTAWFEGVRGLTWGRRNWLVIPPESCTEPARAFKTRGEAQRWATAQIRAAWQQAAGDAT